MAEHNASNHAVAVVLAPKGSEKAAVRALSAERPWDVTAVSDPMLAMAEIALAERAAATRAAWEVGEHKSEGGGRKSGDRQDVAFVLAHPQQWAMRHELLAAITRYLPSARLFAFDERGLQESSASRKARSKAARGQRSGNEGQKAKVSAEALSSGRRSMTSRPSDPAISRDEIEMLLDGESR